jgi:bacterial surface protein 26-residue repeat protein (3 repeats) (fragment)
MEFYYVLSEDERTATCYFDDRCDERGGILPMRSSLGYRLFWRFNRLKKVVFDATCKDYCPTHLYAWFYGCRELKEVIGLENLNTAQVIDMASMFKDCSSLVSIDISSFDTTKVSDMNSMFEGCSALTHLDLSSFNTARVRGMCSMFQGCRSLKSLDLSSFNVSAVGQIDRMFSDCTALTKLDLSYFNPKNVGNMAEMFFNCRELTTIYCMTTWSCGKSEAMFEDCRKLSGAVPYDLTRTDVEMANPETGYFSSEEPNLSLSETASEAAPEKKEEPANHEEQMTPNEFVNCSFFTMQGVPLEGGVADLPAGMYLMKKD